ncbi:fasciclin domain-containing protein, partial [Candidatus Sumerlaeota bacterium]|nr:fasciclin domain-containing protein [Candidatus Sumerlaeota bacterium]
MRRFSLQLSVICVMCSLLAPVGREVRADQRGEIEPDVVDRISSDERLSNFAWAIDLTQQEEILRGEGPWTILAPSNAAYDEIPMREIIRLIRNRAELTEIFRCHVIEGRLSEEDLRALSQVQTRQGLQLPVRQSEGQLWLGTANVVEADIVASNGVIHIVDRIYS